MAGLNEQNKPPETDPKEIDYELKRGSKRYLHLYFHCGIIHNRQEVETT